MTEPNHTSSPEGPSEHTPDVFGFSPGKESDYTPDVFGGGESGGEGGSVTGDPTEIPPEFRRYRTTSDERKKIREALKRDMDVSGRGSEYNMTESDEIEELDVSGGPPSEVTVGPGGGGTTVSKSSLDESDKSIKEYRAQIEVYANDGAGINPDELYDEYKHTTEFKHENHPGMSREDLPSEDEWRSNVTGDDTQSEKQYSGPHQKTATEGLKDSLSQDSKPAMVALKDSITSSSGSSGGGGSTDSNASPDTFTHSTSSSSSSSEASTSSDSEPSRESTTDTAADTVDTDSDSDSDGGGEEHGWGVRRRRRT